ncbi:MFS transporter [Jatrophihabitans sp.]|uniref:MFS transporter n=1 Tax=Jatrophihabitans sp. TaxID=1932789 RepID=UPI002F08AA9F
MPLREFLRHRSATGTHPAALAALAASAFVYVTAETLPVGLLPEISRGLSVSEADVGLLLTSYAAVVALTTIPLTALTMQLTRHRLMAALVAVFTVSQLAASMAPTFLTLTVARLLCALAHGVFWSAIAPAAARLAPPGQAGRATSLVFVGNSLALVLGVPLGTALGQWAGWRVASAVLALAGAFSTAALLLVLPALPASPADLAAGPASRLRAAATVIRAPAVAQVCAVTALAVIGHFTAYTYIAPLARRGGGLAGHELTLLLLGYGALGLLGTVLVGRLVDRRPRAALVSCLGLMIVALTVLAMSRVSGPTVVAVLAWGAAFTALPVCLQSAILRVAPQAQDAASAVYVVAFQIGIGGGALAGDRLVVAGRLGDLPVVGAVLAVAAGLVVVVGRSAFGTGAGADRGEPVTAAEPR